MIKRKQRIPMRDLSTMAPEDRETVEKNAMNGRVFNIFKVLAHHPRLVKRWTPFAGHILAKQTLPFRYERAYLILAGLATPLVFSVHSVVSFDFATAQLPGWHTTIFPPYFVAGAIYSGFAMVFTLLIPARHLFNLKHIIKADHVEAACKIMLATGMMVGLAYASEFFIAWYSGNLFERFTFINRAFGPFWWSYFIMVSCNVLVPQAFWFKKVRRTPIVIFILCILINVGMWFERFVIIATSLARSFLPAQWSYYSPTRYDVGLFVGTLGLFFTLFLLFFRYAPVIAISEVKGAMPEAHAGKKH